MNYKHYSFDVWMTLIKSNPSFKIERAKFFFKHFNGKKKTIEFIIQIFRQVDLMCNSINEKTGGNIDASEMYLMVISIMNDFDPDFNNINLECLYEEIEKLLFNYMPIVYSSDTIKTLEIIKQNGNISFNISSNTAFIKGKTLRKVLSSLQLTQFFDFQLYSDELNVSKPDKKFFESLISVVKKMHNNREIKLTEIIHVGDNPIADIKGALSVGINAVLINSNNLTILNLLK